MALTDKLTAIADALRAKTGGTAQLTLDQIASEISGLSTGGSGSAEAPAEASHWLVGDWAASETGASASKSRCYYSTKMASGVKVTNNMTTTMYFKAAYMNSSGTVASVTTPISLAAGESRTFTSSSASYVYVHTWAQISVMGTTTELALSAKTMFDIANKVTITGTEVS